MPDADRYEVYVEGEELSQEEARGIEKAAIHALRAARPAEVCALTVMVTTDEHIRQLNRDYAGIDNPTDVLSFGAEDAPYEVEPGEPAYLGDVLIARGTAERQAEAAGHSLLAEMQVLAIHGTLHLLGYDHQNPDQQAEMWAAESAALDALRRSP